MKHVHLEPVAQLPGLADHELMALGTQVRLERLRRLDRWRTCRTCGKRFAARAKALYCSGRCRTSAYRKRLRQSEEGQE